MTSPFLLAFLPELVLLAGALGLFAVTLGESRGRAARNAALGLAGAVILASALALGARAELFSGAYRVDAFSQLVYEPTSYERAKKVCERLSRAIPRQQFKVPIQGSIGSKVIARETINPLRKDVLAKCYGGDISRKHKLLEKQKEGKKRMKMVGDVELPQEAFLAVLRTDEETEKKG